MQHGFTSGCESPPAHGLKIGYQEDGSGEYWVAVANTEWGRIPAKAKEGECWYPYGGEEHYTTDFDWVTHPNSMVTIPNCGDGPPPGARPVGYQNDGQGDQYAVIANTEWGRIPGKASNGRCWYPYGGAEHETEDFEYLACSRVSDPCHETMDIDFVDQSDPPENGLKLGWQNDGAGDLWIAVADTEYGKVPGKAKDGTCWYSYNGEELTTDCFQYVVYTSPHKLVPNDNLGPPQGAAVVGNQTDGRGDMYAVIALSEWGRIPAKADCNTCWYPYGGKEHETQDFEWLVFSNDH